MSIVVVFTVFSFDKTIAVVVRECVSSRITDLHRRSIPDGGYSRRSDGPVESPESTLRSSAVDNVAYKAAVLGKRVEAEHAMAKSPVFGPVERVG